MTGAARESGVRPSQDFKERTTDVKNAAAKVSTV
jgi:hypothetical protein